MKCPCECGLDVPKGRETEFTTHEALLKAAKGVLDPDPCRPDHNGNCQSHGISNPCEQAELRKAIDIADGKVIAVFATKEDRDLTVHAMNSHKALLRAVKYVRDRMWVAGIGNALPQGTISKHCFEYLEEAIALAEGKQP